MRIPHPPSGLSPTQIAAYTLAFLTLASITVTVGLLIKPIGIILLVLFSIALICALAYFGLALYQLMVKHYVILRPAAIFEPALTPFIPHATFAGYVRESGTAKRPPCKD
jgi:hypothetical protein